MDLVKFVSLQWSLTSSSVNRLVCFSCIANVSSEYMYSIIKMCHVGGFQHNDLLFVLLALPG